MKTNQNKDVYFCNMQELYKCMNKCIKQIFICHITQIVSEFCTEVFNLFYLGLKYN